MESVYGVAVKNRYDFFIDDDLDPFEVLQKQEEKPKDKASKDAKSDKSKTKSAKSKQNKNKAQMQSQNIPETKANVDQNQNKKEGKFVTVEGKVSCKSTWFGFWQLAHVVWELQNKSGESMHSRPIFISFI